MALVTLMLKQEPGLRPRIWRVRDELVDAVARDEPGAFNRLYNHYYRLVHGIALARVAHCEVDDIVQEVFLIVAQKLHKVRDRRAFQRWLTRITRNCCIDRLRKRERKMTHTLPPEVSHNPPPVAEALSLIDAMQNLPEDYREILILRFVEGYMGPEIAAQLGMTRGSVRIKLHRGMKMLRAELDSEDEK